MENKEISFVNGLIEDNKRLSVEIGIKDTMIAILKNQLKEWENVFSTDHLTNIETKDVVDLRSVAFFQQDGGING